MSPPLWGGWGACSDVPPSLPKVCVAHNMTSKRDGVTKPSMNTLQQCELALLRNLTHLNSRSRSHLGIKDQLFYVQRKLLGHLCAMDTFLVLNVKYALFGILCFS